MGSIELGELRIEVLRKDIKNVHLSVHPPIGRVRIAAPHHLSEDALRAFAIDKLGWIRRQQEKLCAQERETPREYLDHESHYVWGRRYLLQLVETEQPPTVGVKHNRLMMTVRPGSTAAHRQELLDAHYRKLMHEAVPPLIRKWERLLNVSVSGYFVQRMKTRWGSCNHRAGTIRLNAELAKKPRACLEYLVVHEMVHLLEPTHNSRFVALMDRYLPTWRHQRDELNRLPVRHEEWLY